MEKARNLLVRQLFPIPDEPAPAKLRCVSVYIPDSMDHLAAFAGALALLGKWNSWAKDAGHNARVAAVAWQQALMLGIHDCETCEQIFDGILVEDDMASGFRVDPDNNCILQTWCIDHWETFWDISSCVATAAAQAVNGEPVEPGQCREWDVKLNASNKWLVPVSVNAGDTIIISGVNGATNDGIELLWRCGDGQHYIFGLCSGEQYNSDDDPAPDVFHQRLIISVDEVFYDGFNTTFPVPDGVTDAQAFLQINDEILANDAGSLTFHLKICNNNQTTFDHTFNFVPGGQGWMSFARSEHVGDCAPDTTPYVPGQGWGVYRCPSQNATYTNITRNFASRTVSNVEATFVLDEDVADGSAYFLYVVTGGVETEVDTITGPLSAGSHSLNAVGSWPDSTAIRVRLAMNSNTVNARVTLGECGGFGTDPF